MEKNPIPSMKVWFDQKDLKAVVCFDNSTPGGIANEACNNGEFHTHAWVPRGWLDMKTFVNAAAPADLAAAFLRELCMTIGRIRLSWEDQEQRIRNLTDKIERLRKENFAALARIGELELQDERMIPDGCCLITTEQIDAAWRVATDVATEQEEVNRLAPLAELGIVRCEGCDGRGDRSPTEMYQQNGDPTDPTDIECPDCDGHGWV